MPKCVVPWCQICGAVVPNMWCRGDKNVVPAGAVGAEIIIIFYKIYQLFLLVCSYKTFLSLIGDIK